MNFSYYKIKIFIKSTFLICRSFWDTYKYSLPSLNEVEQYITQNHRLHNVLSVAEVKARGVNLGEMNAVLLQKVKELTFYNIDLQKQMNELKQTKGD